MLLELGIMTGGLVAIGLKRPKRKRLIEVIRAEKQPEYKTKASFPTAIEKKMRLFVGKTRRQQLQTISLNSDGNQISAAERRINRAFSAMSIAFGMTILSSTFPPLTLLMLPLLLVSVYPIYKTAYEVTVYEHKVSSYILDVLLISGLLLTGRFLLVTGLGWSRLLATKLLFMSEDNARSHLANLFSEQPRTVWVQINELEIEIPLDVLEDDHLVVVRAGQVIPVDGLIVEGFGTIDQHKLTGEAQPQEKGIGDQVFASTVVLAGRICIQVEKSGQETVAMQIGKILNQTADFRGEMQSRGEAIADKSTLPTIALSTLAWPLLGPNSALAVLVNIFGYKMRVFAPTSMLTFLGVLSNNGILVKDGRSLDRLSSINTVVFDKTGTLTLEQPHVTMVYAWNGINEEQILRYAAGAEYGQTHPIAKAILANAMERRLELPKMEDARYEVGYGIHVDFPGRHVYVGSRQFMELENMTISDEVDTLQQDCHEQGHSLVLVAFDRKIVGAIELQATVRPEAQKIIDELQQRNLATYIISGDQEEPTKRLAQSLGIDHYFANTLPEDKARLIRELQDEGKSVCFIGDGINDSIALKKADVSISLRGATTIATDTAQIVLMDGNLSGIIQLFDIAGDYEMTQTTNFRLSTIPSMICLGGILFFQWGALTGAVINQFVTYSGLINSVMPLFKHQLKENESNDWQQAARGQGRFYSP